MQHLCSPVDCIDVFGCRVRFSVQREKSGRLQLHHLAEHFHLPINEAAAMLGICPTVLKKICRKLGMRRWPHRKVINVVISTAYHCLSPSLCGMFSHHYVFLCCR